jgi:hypothetical protein
MEIDSEKLKQVILELMDQFKELEAEILALRVVIRSLSLQFNIPVDDSALESLLQSAKNNPLIQKMMFDKYDAPRAEFLSQFDKGAETSEKFAEFLRSWKPLGRAH